MIESVTDDTILFKNDTALSAFPCKLAGSARVADQQPVAR
jgi:hypothetical protein